MKFIYWLLNILAGYTPPIIDLPPIDDIVDPPIDPPIPDPPTTIPYPTTDPRIYVPLNKVSEWAAKIDQAYSTWRGARDLRSLSTEKGLKYLNKFTPLNNLNIMALANEMDIQEEKGQYLIFKMQTERNLIFPDRTRVRKSVVNEQVRRLLDLTAEYTSIANLFPLVQGCDSIRCKINKS